MIRQGEVYWADLGPPSGSGPGFRHPHVVVQNDLFNRSALQTTIVCVITSNPKWARLPGNVQLAAGEAGLPQPSVVNVSQLYTVDKEDLVERIGTLSPDRLAEVLAGLHLITDPRTAW